MSLRELALLMVVVLTVPASIALLRPRHRADAAAGATTPRRALEALWVVVPALLLVALAILSVVA